MKNNNTIFDDLVEALHEVEEYQKGNIILDSDNITIPDDISIFS